MNAPQDKKINAIVAIVGGLFMLFKVPGLLAMWLIPGAEEAPSFDTAGRTMMIGGGVMLIAGAAMAWHAWARPK
jgi:hypothetical protein